MDASTIFLAALILHLSLCVAAKGKFDGTQGLALSGSVFQIFRGTTLQQCRRLCVYSSRCLSVNWSSSTRECQLNSEKGNREPLLVSDKNFHLSVQEMTLQGHPCASQPCSTDHMCIPVDTAKDHVCVRVGAFMPTTAAGITNSAITTATVTTASPQAASATTSSASRTTLEETTTATGTTGTTTTTSATTVTTTTTTTATAAAATTTTTTTTSTAAATAATTTTTTSLKDTAEPELTSPITTTPISTSTTSVGTTTSPEPTTSASPAPSTTTTTITTLEPYNGTCVTDIDCAVPPGRTCSGGVCICSIGYDMDETRIVCRKLIECTSYGSDFTLHVHRAITGHNSQSFRSKTSVECARLCLHADTECKSFEIMYHVCYLQPTTWFEVDVNDQRVDRNVDHYQRRCKW